MDYELLFRVLSFVPGPIWICLIFFIDRPLAMRLTDIVLVLYSLFFSILVIPDIGHLLPLIADPHFESIRSELATPKGFLGTWTHMILGDLWIGRWIALDGFKNGDPGWLRASFVLVVMFFGPLGLFAYLLFRMLRHRLFWMY